MEVNRMKHTIGGKEGESIIKSKGSTIPFYHLLILFYFLVIYRWDFKALLKYDPSGSLGYAYVFIWPMLIFLLTWFVNFLVGLFFNKNYLHSRILEIIFYTWYFLVNKKHIFDEYGDYFEPYIYEKYLGVSYEFYFLGGLFLMFLLFRVLDLAFLITRNQKQR